jgi:hypothetical protein
MATSIFNPPAFNRACSALSDKVGRKPVSIATGPNRAEKLLDETVSARGPRMVVTGALHRMPYGLPPNARNLPWHQ